MQNTPLTKFWNHLYTLAKSVFFISIRILKKVKLRFFLILKKSFTKQAIYRIGKKQNSGVRIRVVFIVYDIEFFKFERLIGEFDLDNRFETFIVVTVRKDKSINPSQYHEIFQKSVLNYKSKFRVFGENKNYKYQKKFFKKLKPDMLFHSSPYSNFPRQFTIYNTIKALNFYLGYGIPSSNIPWVIKNNFTYLINDYFLQSSEQLQEVVKYYSEDLKPNFVITGYPFADNIIRSQKSNHQFSNPLTIIWAPHHSVELNNPFLNLNSFLDYHQFFYDLPALFQDKVRVVFRPHPILKEKLYKNKDWGYQKANLYWDMWRDKNSLRLISEGEYIDLFNSADVLINNSSTFITEWLYTGKPAMLILNSIKDLKQFNKFALKAIECYELAFNQDDIIRFLKSIIIDFDSKSYCRVNYYNTFLASTHGVASKNVFEYIDSNYVKISF